MTPMTAARAAEELLRDGLGLRPLPLAPELGHMQGTFRGAPAVLTTRVYVGERVRYARVATLVGAGLAVGNLLVVPSPAFDTPILGVDLVAIGRDTVLLAADLSPTAPPHAAARARAERALRGVHASLAGLAAAGSLPAWADRCFSAAPLFVRVPAQWLVLAAAAVETLTKWFVADLCGAVADDASAAATDRAARDYLAAHLDDTQTLGMLAKVFRTGPVDRYVRMILFPQAEALP